MTRSRLDSCDRVLYTALKLAFDILLLDLHAISLSICLSRASQCERKAEVKSRCLIRLKIWQCFPWSCLQSASQYHILIFFFRVEYEGLDNLILLLPLELFQLPSRRSLLKVHKMNAKRFNRSCARNKSQSNFWIRQDTWSKSWTSPKVCEYDLDTFLNRTPIFDQCVLRWWLKTLSMGISCFKEVGWVLQIY